MITYYESLLSLGGGVEFKRVDIRLSKELDSAWHGTIERGRLLSKSPTFPEAVSWESRRGTSLLSLPVSRLAVRAPPINALGLVSWLRLHLLHHFILMTPSQSLRCFGPTAHVCNFPFRREPLCMTGIEIGLHMNGPQTDFGDGRLVRFGHRLRTSCKKSKETDCCHLLAVWWI